jgi:hypothetical protein
MVDDSELTAALEALLGQRREGMEPPTVEELLAYWEGRLVAEEAARTERKLAAYPEATELLQDLNRFGELEDPPGVTPLSEADVEERWRELEARIDAEPEHGPFSVGGQDRSSGPAPELEASRSSSTRRGVPRWWAMAAVLVAGVLGWTGGMLFPHGALLRMTSVPEAGGGTLSLAPEKSRLERANEPRRNVVETGRSLFLLLELPLGTKGEQFQVEVEGPEGRTWHSPASPTEFREINLHLPGAWLQPGDHRVTLRDEAGTEIANYRFEAR